MHAPGSHRHGGTNAGLCFGKTRTDSPMPVTIGIGLAAQRDLGPRLRREEELVRAADTALYCAKANGRNRVEQAPEIFPAASARAAAVQ